MTTVASFKMTQCHFSPRFSSSIIITVRAALVNVLCYKKKNPYAMPFRLPRMSRFCASLSSLLSCDTAGRKAFFFVLATSKERLNDIRLKVPLPIRIFLFWMPSVKGYVNHVFFPLLEESLSSSSSTERELKEKKNREKKFEECFFLFSPRRGLLVG